MGSTAKTDKRRCPSCGVAVDKSEENKVFPFCSERCQLVDLSRWLDGDYRIAGEPAFILPDEED